MKFLQEEVDAGAIIVQKAVEVFPSDTVTILSERVKLKEWQAYPEALELVASGKAMLKDSKIIWT